MRDWGQGPEGRGKECPVKEGREGEGRSWHFQDTLSRAPGPRQSHGPFHAPRPAATAELRPRPATPCAHLFLRVAGETFWNAVPKAGWATQPPWFPLHPRAQNEGPPAREGPSGPPPPPPPGVTAAPPAPAGPERSEVLPNLSHLTTPAQPTPTPPQFLGGFSTHSFRGSNLLAVNVTWTLRVPHFISSRVLSLNPKSVYSVTPPTSPPQCRMAPPT